jgi:hypothetical protein
MSESLKSPVGLEHKARDEIADDPGCKELLFRFTVQRMLRMDSLNGFPARATNIALTIGEELLAIQTDAWKDEVEECTNDGFGNVQGGNW